MKKLKKLAQDSSTVDQFITEARRFVKWYGFPGQGTINDYQTFYNAVKREK